MEKDPNCEFCRIGDTRHSHKPFYELPKPNTFRAVAVIGGERVIFKRYKSKKKKNDHS